MRGPLIGGKYFQLPLNKVKNLKEGSWRRTKEREEYLVFCERKGGEGKYGKEISSYVGKVVVHEEKNMCKQKHGRKLCVAST
jgi:hypothetical protein